MPCSSGTINARPGVEAALATGCCSRSTSLLTLEFRICPGRLHAPALRAPLHLQRYGLRRGGARGLSRRSGTGARRRMPDRRPLLPLKRHDELFRSGSFVSMVIVSGRPVSAAYASDRSRSISSSASRLRLGLSINAQQFHRLPKHNPSISRQAARPPRRSS